MHACIVSCRWMESIIGEELPPLTELEENLRNGVVLCKLGMKLFPDDPQWKRVCLLIYIHIHVYSVTMHTCTCIFCYYTYM